MLARERRTLHHDAWALVHAGGNDLLHSSPHDILWLVGKVLCCCCCLPCSDIPAIDHAIANIRALAVRLRSEFGVRNLLLCGLPLTMHMPVVDRYLELLLGEALRLPEALNEVEHLLEVHLTALVHVRPPRVLLHLLVTWGVPKPAYDPGQRR